MTDDLAMARGVIDANAFVTLATTDENGTPWVSPVFFTPHGYRRLYWVSGPETQHSRNLAVRPELSMVVFDSSTLVSAPKEAVYLSGRAAEVPAGELADACAEAFASLRFPGMRMFEPADLQPPALLRLYRADVDQAWIHVGARDPHRGTGVDSRAELDLH